MASHNLSTLPHDVLRNWQPQSSAFSRAAGLGGAKKPLTPPGQSQSFSGLKWLQECRPQQGLALQLCTAVLQLRQLEQAIHQRLQAAGLGQHLPSQLAARVFGQFALQHLASTAKRSPRALQRVRQCTQMALDVGILTLELQSQGVKRQRQLTPFARYLQGHGFVALAEGLGILAQLANALQKQ